jgi:6-pyruvoyltetrahydropterin/6-carboxytetrahydropterin synthase
MTAAGRYRLTLAKQDFKFACAHFTVFDEGRAELLHGHNYRVRVEVAAGRLGDHGLLLDIERFKVAIRRECAALDSLTLVPTGCPLLGVVEEDGEVEVRFGERRYRLPAADAYRLPAANSTMELLAELLWERLAPELAGTPIDTLTVSVEESDGQRASVERQL